MITYWQAAAIQEKDLLAELVGKEKASQLLKTILYKGRGDRTGKAMIFRCRQKALAMTTPEREQVTLEQLFKMADGEG